MQYFFSLKFGPNKKKFYLTRVKLSLDPVIQTNTPIKQCLQILLKIY